MNIKKGDTVRVTEFCFTPDLRGRIGKVMRNPRNNHFIVKFPKDGQLYIFGGNEVSGIVLVILSGLISYWCFV